MEIKTVCSWDDELWHDASPLYSEAFGDKNPKPVKIIKNMFAKGICELHVGYNKAGAVAMALTGKLTLHRVMIVDYLAVSEKDRGHGLGRHFVAYLHKRAMEKGYQKIIIETEAEETPDNRRRIHFWESCGFILTEYIHQYIWVPETYQAMYLPLVCDSKKVTGEELFKFFKTFHRLSFRGAGEEEG